MKPHETRLRGFIHLLPRPVHSITLPILCTPNYT
jgi:hypothetical protein